MGKDAHSLGYNFGINDVVIEKVQDIPSETGATPEPEDDASNKTPSGTVYRGEPLAYYTAKAKNSSGQQEVDALYALGQFGTDGAGAVEILGNALSDSSADVRAAAATSLANLGSANASAVPNLTKALSDANPRVRSMAAMALEASGRRAASAVPQLAKSLQDPADSVRHFAADALGAIGPQAASAVPALAARLSVSDERGFVYASVTSALGNIGPDAKSALPALQRAVNERHSSGAQRAILQIEGKPEPATYY
jgi:HEAT repeat protein